MWSNILEPDRPRVTIWRMRTACWMPKATHAHSEYVILVPFRQQQWLHERASILRYTYILLLLSLEYFREGFYFNYKGDDQEHSTVAHLSSWQHWAS
jgi:hypothetical protein